MIGSPTSETRLKIASNTADPIVVKTKTLMFRESTITQWFRSDWFESLHSHLKKSKKSIKKILVVIQVFFLSNQQLNHQNSAENFALLRGFKSSSVSKTRIVSVQSCASCFVSCLQVSCSLSFHSNETFEKRTMYTLHVWPQFYVRCI